MTGFHADVVSYMRCGVLCPVSRACLPDRALELFDEMKRKGCAPNGVTYGALVDALGRAGRIEAALAMKAEMESIEKGRGLSRYPPTAVTYCSLIAACARKGRVAQAQALAAEAHARGIPLNTAAYNALLSVYTLAAARAAAAAAATAATPAARQWGGLDEDGRLLNSSGNAAAAAFGGATPLGTPSVHQWLQQQRDSSRLANGHDAARDAAAGGGAPQWYAWGTPPELATEVAALAPGSAGMNAAVGRQSLGTLSSPVQDGASPFLVAPGGASRVLQPAGATALSSRSSRGSDSSSSVTERDAVAAASIIPGNGSSAMTQSSTVVQNSTVAQSRTLGAMTQGLTVAESSAGVAQVLEAMRQRGVPWDGITYATLVDHAGKCGDVARAEGLLREMRSQPGLWLAGGKGAALEAATALMHAYGAQVWGPGYAYLSPVLSTPLGPRYAGHSLRCTCLSGMPHVDHATQGLYHTVDCLVASVSYHTRDEGGYAIQYTVYCTHNEGFYGVLCCIILCDVIAGSMGGCPTAPLGPAGGWPFPQCGDFHCCHASCLQSG